MSLRILCISFVHAVFGYSLYGGDIQSRAHLMTTALGVGCMIAHQVNVPAICSSFINFALSYNVQPFVEAVGHEYSFLFFAVRHLFNACRHTHGHVR
jgi:hypothetical protein